MTTTTHTPGPWHIGMRPGPIVYGRYGEQVADMRDTVMDADEAYKNLKLIAAAPELLEALKDALEALEGASEALGNPAGVLDLAMNDCRAAIAKAEGGL